MFVISLLIDLGGIRGSFFDFLSPSTRSTLTLGASGAYPITVYGSWWTVFSSPYLHGGLIHLGFNMAWVRFLSHMMVKFYSFSKLVIIYTLSSICGDVLTTMAAIHLPPPFAGAQMAVGASGAVFGLFGALVSYGLQSGSRSVSGAAWQFAVLGFIYGLLMPHTDNWGHLGGFLGGFALTHTPWLSYKSKDNAFTFILALLCFVAVLASIIASVLQQVTRGN